MQIKVFDSLPSTQEYLTAQIKAEAIKDEVCIVAKSQSKGIGSRGNVWEGVESGLYLSFAMRLDTLPKDLQRQSMAIFFAFIFVQNLRDFGSDAWLKYPNDLFLGRAKIGGAMCGIVKNFAVCGIGLNLKCENFACVEKSVGGKIKKDLEGFLKRFFRCVEVASWSEVFSAYSAEFHKNYGFSFHAEGEFISLQNATLQTDGAIKVGGKIIYSVRN